MRKLYDLARGVAELEVSGAQPERILNYCAENGIEFWNASPCRDFSITFCVHASDVDSLLAQSGKNGLDVKLISEAGGRKLMLGAKRRAVFLLAFVFCVSLAAVSSLFLWRIEISGNDKLSDAEILRKLSECGVDYGA